MSTQKLDEDVATHGEKIGDVVDGRYRITGLLGSGGMGTVFEAEHVTLRRPVALKMLHPFLGSLPEIARRFEREAYAAGKIVHPNCVAVTDFGQLTDGRLYLAMELLAGIPLSKLLGEQPRLSVERSLRIARHVLRGLGHAHQLGIVHRDVKPDNVILVEQGGDPDFAKVLDFGIAKLVGDVDREANEDRLTRAGVSIGTPTYMSPEQALGQSVDPRTDLYSLSVMLFEMLAGRPPFVAEDPLRLLSMHTASEPPRLSEVAPDIGASQEVGDLLKRGLAKRLDQRIPTAESYIAAVDRCLEALPRKAEPKAMFTPETHAGGARVAPFLFARVARRRAIWAGGLALLVLAILVAVVSGGDTNPAFFRDREKLLDMYTFELEEGATCEDRRKAVLKLRALGDRRAIAALKKARRRMRGGVLGVGATNENHCLREDAQQAIEHLLKL